MFGYPIYQQSQPQKSIKEQIDELELLSEFLKKKYEKKDDKGSPKLKDKKFSIWEGGLILWVFSFTCAVPIVGLQLSSIYNLFQTMNRMFK